MHTSVLINVCGVIQKIQSWMIGVIVSEYTKPEAIYLYMYKLFVLKIKASKITIPAWQKSLAHKKLYLIPHRKQLDKIDSFLPWAVWYNGLSVLMLHDDVIKWKHLLVAGLFPSQRPEVRSFDVFFDLRLNKQLSKQWWGWWFETPLCPLWRHFNG